MSLPIKSRKWRLATDASKIAMGAVLSQIDENDEEHPIAYYSKKLTPTESRWDIWELELAAVVWATSLCKHYLRATHFELITDSKVVAALLKKDVPSRRENLVLRMSEFEFTVTHRKGELNRNADFFSRWIAYKDWTREQAVKANDTEISTLTRAVDFEISTLTKGQQEQQLLEEQRQQKQLEQIAKILAEEQRKDKKLAKYIHRLENPIRPVEQPDEKQAEKQVVLAQLAPEQEEDKRKEAIFAERVKQFTLLGKHGLLAKQATFPKSIRRAERAEEKQPQIEYTTYWPILVPPSMVPAVLSFFHGDTSALGHPGKHKTYGTIKTRFTWKGLMTSVRKWLASCHKCLRRKRVVPKHQTYSVHEGVRAPMNKIAMDIVGPLKRTARGNAYILTIYDTFSHWPSAYPITSTRSKVVINCIKHHVALHSVPAAVLTDRGKNFMSKDVTDFLDLLGAKKLATTPYKPSTNGSVERFHAYLAQSVSHVVKRTHEDWGKHLECAIRLPYHAA